MKGIMEIIYNGSYCGDELFKTILKNQDIPMSYAQEKLEKMLFKGFNSINCVNMTAISAVPARAFPGNKKLWWHLKTTSVGNNVVLKQLAFINILGVKQMMFMFGSLVETFNWCFTNRKNKNKAMLSYSANPPILLPMLFICKLWGVKNIIIVTEVPKYRFYDGQTSWIRSSLLKIMVKVSTWLQEHFDGYILLTEYMNSQVNNKNKPHLVMEGMVDIDKNEMIMKENGSGKKKVILYTGTLNREYGFSTLIEGFKMLNMPNVELWFCGQGNYQNEIELASNDFEQIRYFGMLSHSEVSQLQIQADFLINPRPTNSEYTKYSFPSKTLEYMLMKTPVISTRLKGIPHEYDDFLIYIENETAQGYCDELRSILEDDYVQYTEKALKGKRFVVENKDAKVQSKRILGFIEKLL